MVEREEGEGKCTPEQRGIEEGGWKVAFWNVAGLANKDKEF